MNESVYPVKIRETIEYLRKYRRHQKRGFKQKCLTLLAEGKKCKDNDLVGVAYYYLSEYYYIHPKNYSKTSVFLQKAVIYLELAHDYEFLTLAYNFLGNDASNHGINELALDYYGKAAEYESKYKSGYLGVLVEYNQAILYDEMGEKKLSLRYIIDACDKIIGYPDCGYYFNAIQIYGQIQQGILYIELDNVKKAGSALRKVNTLLSKLSAEDRKDYSTDPLYLMLGVMYYHLSGMNDKRDQIMTVFLNAISESVVLIDTIPDVLRFCEALLDHNEFYDYVKKILDILREEVLDSNVAHIMMSYHRAEIMYYREVGDTEKAHEAAVAFFDASELHRSHSKVSYSYFLNLQDMLLKMRTENKRLEAAATTDALTGLPNRASLNTHADIMFDKAKKDGVRLAVEILDIDNFKTCNDNYGHRFGDRCLQAVAGVIKSIVSDRIFAARYGGDEFVIMYYCMSDDEVTQYATALQKGVRDICLTSDMGTMVDHRLSISQGIHNHVPTGNNRIWDFLYIADNLLYDVKNGAVNGQKGEIIIHNTRYYEKPDDGRHLYTGK